MSNDDLLTHLPEITMDGCTYVHVDIYDEETGTLRLAFVHVVDGKTYCTRMNMPNIMRDVARRMLAAFATPSTPIRHGNTVSAYGDWAITEHVIDKLTGADDPVQPLNVDPDKWPG